MSNAEERAQVVRLRGERLDRLRRALHRAEDALVTWSWGYGHLDQEEANLWAAIDEAATTLERQLEARR